MKIFVAVEMIGTVNGLAKALEILRAEGHELRFAAAGAALPHLQRQGIEYLGPKEDPRKVLKDFAPDIVVVGCVDMSPSHPDWSNLERSYGLDALRAGIPTIVYRDFVGIHNWVKILTARSASRQLLHFFLFDNGTAGAIKDWQYRSIEVVGSGYYDDDVTRDWAGLRTSARLAADIRREEFALMLFSPSSAELTLEVMEPMVASLTATKSSNLLLFPCFHPKDPDAPFVETTKGVYTARPSAPYDPLIEAIEAAGVRVMREPLLRNAVPDPKGRIAAADFIMQLPAATDTYTAAYAHIPQLIFGLPKIKDNATAKHVSIEAHDLIVAGAADVVYTAAQLRQYAASLPHALSEIHKRQAKGWAQLSLSPAAPFIAAKLLAIAGRQ